MIGQIKIGRDHNRMIGQIKLGRDHNRMTTPITKRAIITGRQQVRSASPESRGSAGKRIKLCVRITKIRPHLFCSVHNRMMQHHGRKCVAEQGEEGERYDHITGYHF
jgi:hypothetical protein